MKKEYICLDCEHTFTDNEVQHTCPHCMSDNIEEMPDEGFDEDGFYEGEIVSR